MNDLVSKAAALTMEAHRREAKHWTPHPYQERAMQFMLEDSQCGLLASPGTGKTSTTLAVLKILFKKKLAKRALILAPLRAVDEVWPIEVSDWQDFHELSVAVLHGSNKDKILRQLRPEHNVVLMNFEGLPWLYAKKERAKLLAADVLVIDESSKIKSPVSQRFRILRAHITEFKRRYILTGSPRPQSYLDLFAQIYVLDRGATLGSYITHYRNQFFFPTGFQGRTWELLPGADKKIDSAVAPMVLRIAAEDYLTLPGKPERFHYVALPPDVRTEYDSIEGNLLSTLFTTPLVNSASARSKCSQIANGSVYLDDLLVEGKLPTHKRPVKVVHTAKVDALVDLVEELQGEPILISIGYHHDVEAIRKALGKDIPCLNSDVTRTQAAQIIEDWNAGRLPVLLGHPQSCGHGLNLQKCQCRQVAFFNIPDDYDLYDQFYQRVCRQGNKAAFVMKHHFVARATVDVAKMANLRRKGSGQQAFLDAMRAYAEEKYGKLPSLTPRR